MREHKYEGSVAGREVEAGGDQLSGNQMRAMQIAQWCKSARGQLKQQADKAVHALLLGANLFQMAVRGMDEKELSKKLEVNVAEALKDKLVDKVTDTFREGIVEASDIGKEIANRSIGIFGTLKGKISDRIKTQEKLTVLQVADAVTAAMIEEEARLTHAMHGAIDTLPRSKVLAIRESLAMYNGVTADADGEEQGYLRDGLKVDFMTRFLGLPAGDTVAAEQYATQAFATFQMGIIGTMPAHEAGEAIQKRLENPDGDKQAIKSAEEQLGPTFKHDLQRDEALRKRVNTEA